MKRNLAIALATAAVLSGVAISAQDKYTVKLPNGLAFSDWRGYEDWQPGRKDAADGGSDVQRLGA
jgi:hypothetical protein